MNRRRHPLIHPSRPKRTYLKDMHFTPIISLSPSCIMHAVQKIGAKGTKQREDRQWLMRFFIFCLAFPCRHPSSYDRFFRIQCCCSYLRANVWFVVFVPTIVWSWSVSFVCPMLQVPGAACTRENKKTMLCGQPTSAMARTMRLWNGCEKERMCERTKMHFSGPDIHMNRCAMLCPLLQ
ncbi:hypothetical protein F5H01DRAFT_356086 [Linnemannia elongata]|nr:hypothetical protein F5H01DRAFT_356086 [Linnemannia elongata]